VLWCVIAIIPKTSATTGYGPPLLAEVPFIAVGLYLGFFRFLVRARSLRMAGYVVTNWRVIISGGLSGTGRAEAWLTRLDPPVITERADGSGDLAFGSFPTMFDRTYDRRRGWQGWGPDPLLPPVFRGIEQVRYVRDLIASTQAAAHTTPPYGPQWTATTG
jgi:hypothetical protein